MAKKTREYYICDRCKKELTEKDTRYEVGDFINAYNYDLCDDCYKEYEEYKSRVEDLDKEVKKMTKLYRFGKYMYEVGTPADVGMTSEQLAEGMRRVCGLEIR